MLKKCLLLIAISMAMSLNQILALDKTAKTQTATDKAQTKSVFQMPPIPFFGPNGTSFPSPFNETNNTVASPAISTGYYFVDSDDDQAEDFWRPVPRIVDTSDSQGGTWIKIESGPRQKPYLNEADAVARWADPNDWGINGQTYFRNPALPLEAPGVNWFTHGPAGATDSTDNAIAGPIPLFINGGFYFNGIRYDSFYVSTNGIIALTNRRYRYDDATGLRKNEGGDCYDPMSMDWYVGSFYNPATGTTVDRTRSAEGSESSTNTSIEPVEDDFGYEYAVLGGDRWNPYAGIRQRGGDLNSFNSNHKAALIAPFFGDMQLSQFSVNKNRVDEFGQCWFRKYSDGDKLIIYFVQIAPVNAKALPPPAGAYNAPYDLRFEDMNMVCGNAQVVLDRRDSSIIVNYERFDGSAFVVNRGYPARVVFRYNTACGVRGFARHNGYHHWRGVEGRCPSGEYEQYTHYFSSYQSQQASYPGPQTAVKFKQWKNTLRVADISYRVRSLDPNDNLDYTKIVSTQFVNNYELLAGEERIGAIQPVALIQNLSNEIQGPVGSGPCAGVNFVEQEFNFRARFRIYNEATQKPVYNRVIPIDSTGLAIETDDKDAQNEYFGDPNVKVRYSRVTKSNGVYTATPLDFPGNDELNGIPPYSFVEVYFQPFEPNEFVQSQIGRMKALIVAEPSDPASLQSIGDQWPFDDKDSVLLFSMNRLTSFKDDVTEFHNIYRQDMPSVLKWVNINAEVMPGEAVSYHPLPPRQVYDDISQSYIGFKAQNNPNIELYSPVIKMNRIQNTNICDELRSFPINLIGREHAVLSVSIQRSANSPSISWDRGWCDGSLIGPEPRCIINSDELERFTSSRSASASPDALLLQIAKPSPDGIHGIVNIDMPLPFIPSSLRGSWQYHPRRGGAKAVTNNSAYALYGGGGAVRGFLETDADSALSLPNYPNGPRNGLRTDVYDDGIDFEYQKIFVEIPDTFLRAPNEGAKNFRFRLVVNATDDKKCTTCIPDDDDPFYVDNVAILYPEEMTDLEISSCKIIWPYTMVPASQAIKIPVRAKISNNTRIHAPTFFVKVKIYRGNYLNHDDDPVYCRVEERPFLPTGAEREISMPDWDARKSGILSDGQYHMVGIVRVPGGDLESLNDTTFFDFNLAFGDVFAYDPPNGTNNVPSFTGNASSGRGLSLMGYSEGGWGNLGIARDWFPDPYSFGADGGNSSGEIASKFEFFQTDTVKGFQAWFGKRNMAPDFITYRIYKDQAGGPGLEVTGSRIERAQRGRDDIRNDYFYGEYVTVLLDEPVVLPRGKYWVAVAQLGQTGLELGGSEYKMGMRTTQVYIPPPSGGLVGGNGNSLMIHKDFRAKNNFDKLLNNNMFAYVNTAESGEWRQFMPNMANPGYAHLHHYGVSPTDNTTWTLSRGTWIPMLRPYLGEKYYDPYPTYDDCELPVELIYFKGEARENGVDLFWETATEENNMGFYVERRELIKDEAWEKIGFVAGMGTTKDRSSYSYIDKDVACNSTYQYRLRQIDLDGASECKMDIVEVYIGTIEKLQMTNSPNPFSEFTTINYSLANDCKVRVEVLDIFGNVVNVLKNEFGRASANNTLIWRGDYQDGSLVSQGTYILRILAGDDVRTTKMTLTR